MTTTAMTMLREGSRVNVGAGWHIVGAGSYIDLDLAAVTFDKDGNVGRNLGGAMRWTLPIEARAILANDSHV